MKAGGTPPKIPSVGEARMRGRLGVRCPKCRAAPGHRCRVISPGPSSKATGEPRATPHHERKAGIPYGRADASLAPTLGAQEES